MITKSTIATEIQKHLDLPDNVLDRLAEDLYRYVSPFLSKSKQIEEKAKSSLTLKDLENLLTAVQKLKEIHSTVEPRYPEDVLYVDHLQKMEGKLNEILFEHN